MDISLILSFLGASIILSFMPGPDNIFVLTESITKGYKNGVSISVGLCTGVLIHTLAAATGLSIILQQSTIAFTIIKYLGAVYLFYLAYKAYHETQPNIEFKTSKETLKEGILPLIRKGFFMNVLNPKVSLFFIAFLPQFITSDGMNITVQMIILGLIFMVQALIIFSGIAFLSGRLTKYVNHPRFWRYTKGIKIGVLVGLAVSLGLVER